MNHDDRDLRSLFEDAVSDVVPGDRLGEIRRATAKSASRKPNRWALVLAAGTATAAVVGAGALVGQLGPDDNPPASDPDDTTRAVAAYFLGETPSGDRLFREFQSVDGADGAAALALEAVRLLESDAGATDPDYNTVWPAGAFLDVALSDDGIQLTISDEASNDPAVTSVDGLQQAVFTAQAAVGETLPVSFAAGGRTIRDDVQRDTALLTPVNISDPVEGHSVSGDLTLRGTARSAKDNFDNVSWSLAAADGEVALSGLAPVTGTAWETTTDIADLAPGRYVLTVSAATDNGTATDTRTVTVR
ncbi:MULTISPECIES: hypothetical protein [unclassified Nocardioides]|uniref:hypothetical protein n=1 Tax=unclassified Nocardioides TaxID=2615069 RepID=UPI0006F5FE5F|nr:MULTISPECIES: hypothetical protein [unclassified Nocardioides]KRA29435.1 hypothetical protein ASD81_20845 [Nocardioides sp. Root614]KRA88390.1 hypothetical protein ASD84_20770 [Nocardioides sp. Root682]